jgi:hypothetical protein
VYRGSNAFRGQKARSKFSVPSSARTVLSPVQTFRPITVSGLDTLPPSSDTVEDQDNADSADDDTKEPERYPKTELEWLATTIFNRAVDYYLQEDDDKAKKWAEKVSLAVQNPCKTYTDFVLYLCRLSWSHSGLKMMVR